MMILTLSMSVHGGAKKPNKRFIVFKKKKSTISFSTKGNSRSTKTEKSVVSLNNNSWRKELLEHQTDPSVDHIEEDIIMKRFSNDTYFNNQWALDQLQASAIWNQFDQNSGITVAVVDTGIVSHPELNSLVLPGADFISDASMGNDGDGRDTNAADPGDWVNSSDFCYRGISEKSSWHGTHVAGIIAAQKNNNQGIAGLYDGVKILPVRVLGKCGGFTSDIADGLRWAAGLSVSGMPENQNPAKVINMSLGAAGPCGRTMQEAVDAAILAGSVVVVAAGNDGQSLDRQAYSPANCEGVITVGASEQNKDIPSYSNTGSFVDVYAPGGDSWSGVLSTYNNGDTSPGSATYEELNGTSMAAPYVSATVAFMMAVNSNLYPLQYRNIIKANADSEFSWSKSMNFKFMNALKAIDAASSTARDDRYRYIPSEPVISGGVGLFKPASGDDGGVGCGSIAIINQDGGNGGGPGQKSSFLLGLILALIAGLSSQKRKRRS